MSFDVFLQSFRGGEAAEAPADVVRGLIDPFVVKADASFVRIQTSDGEADVHGYDDPSTGLMVNHASGNKVWDLLADLAHSAGLVVMPVGASVCVASEAMVDELPDELRHDVVVVQSGADLLAVITA